VVVPKNAGLQHPPFGGCSKGGSDSNKQKQGRQQPLPHLFLFENRALFTSRH